jgi:hypothetical protein
MPGAAPSTVTDNDAVTTLSPGADDGGQDNPHIVGNEPAEDVSASSPDPEKAETRESLLDAVKSAIQPKDGDADPEEKAKADGASPASESAEEEKPLGDITEEELNAYRPRTKRRIEQLLSETRTLKSEIEPLRVRAKTTEELQGYLKKHDIGQEDFGLLLDLGAAMRRGDFKAFLEGVTPYVMLAQESLGVTLPTDLREAVRQGHMSEDAARYTAQQRGMRALAEGKAAKFESEREASNIEAQRKDLMTNIETAVGTWEKGIKKADPNYAQKQPVIMDLLHAVVQERGPPKNGAEAVAIAEAAYDRANGMLQRFAPRPRATTANPSSLGQRVNGARAEPKSLLEAAQQALERSR